MQVGDVFQYNGTTYEVRQEQTEYSCEGCALVVKIRDRRTGLYMNGCTASGKDRIFDSCKHDHVIFIKRK